MIGAMRSKNNGTRLSDGRYQIRVTITLPDGTKVKKSVSAKKLKTAQEKAEKLRNQKPKSVVTTLGALVKEFREHGAYSRYAGSSKEVFDWAFGHWKDFEKEPVGAITTPMVYSAVNMLGATKLSGRSVQVVRNSLKTVLQYGVLTGAIPFNPAKDVPLPKKATRKAPPVVLPSVVEQAIQSEPNPRFRAYFSLLYWSGMRPYKEAAKVTADDCWEEEGMGWFSVRDSKTSAGVREVAVPIEVYRDCLPYLPFGFNQGNACREWRQALERIGADYFSPYQLRALRYNLWRQMGLDALVITGQMGHVEESTGRVHYGRSWRQVTTDALKMHYAMHDVEGSTVATDDLVG